MSSNAKSSINKDTCRVSIQSNNIKVSNEFDKNLTLNEVEKQICKKINNQMAIRRTSISDLTKTIGEIAEKNPSKELTFKLVEKSEGIIDNLTNSEILFNNGSGMCFAATYYQRL